jgi:hypothetical protein
MPITVATIIFVFLGINVLTTSMLTKTLIATLSKFPGHQGAAERLNLLRLSRRGRLQEEFFVIKEILLSEVLDGLPVEAMRKARYLRYSVGAGFILFVGLIPFLFIDTYILFRLNWIR